MADIEYPLAKKTDVDALQAEVAAHKNYVDSRFEDIENQAGHTHANKPVLDALSDNNGVLQYNGEYIGGSGGSTEITEQAIVDALGYTPADEDNVYPKQEIDTKLNGKANANHDHDTRYYTKAEIDAQIGDIGTLLASI